MKHITTTLLIILVLIIVQSCSNKVDKSDLRIIEGKRIGKYSLSLTKSELDNLKEVKIDTLHSYYTYTLPDIKIWYDTINKRTNQICAYNNYSGKFRNEISINDSLMDLEKIGWFHYQEENQIYKFRLIRGITFNVFEQEVINNINHQTIEAICIKRK
ncbi:hypothetical protein WNY78_00650 [Psychroserpens sp. AS72]|uniref:hypothetical protein n=1 Tax=Psychroserpens sp. AS72 TaxID=3135775 RepID=UPI00317CFBFA